MKKYKQKQLLKIVLNRLEKVRCEIDVATDLTMHHHAFARLNKLDRSLKQFVKKLQKHI